MDMSTRSEKHENEDCSGYWKVKVKSYESNMKQNHASELLGYSKFKI